MKVYVLRWGDNLLGVFSSKEKADEAEVFYSDLPWFDNQMVDFWQDEYELDKFSDEEYQLEDKVKDNSIKGKMRSFAMKMILYVLAFIVITILGLGIHSFFEIIFNLFKH